MTFVGNFCGNTGMAMQDDEAILIEDKGPLQPIPDNDLERIESSYRVWSFIKTDVSPTDIYLLGTSGSYYLPLYANGEDIVSVHIPLKSVTGSINGTDIEPVGETTKYVEVSTLNTEGKSLGEVNEPVANVFYFQSSLPQTKL